MIFNLSIELPDETPAPEVAAYLRAQADNAAGQIEQSIIALPEVDEMMLMDITEEREAQFFRSE